MLSKWNRVWSVSAGYWTTLFRIPGLGWRIGLDALVGLIPGVGDTATTLASLYVLTSAVRYRVPKVTLLRMGLNLGIDYAVGSLPLVGDLFDAWWKSNQKNIELLRQRATVSASEAREGKISDWLFVGLIILLLVGLAVGAALVSVFLLMLIAGQISNLIGRIRSLAQGAATCLVDSSTRSSVAFNRSTPRSPAAKLRSFPSASNR